MSKKPNPAGQLAPVETTVGSEGAAPLEIETVALETLPEAPAEATAPALPTSAIGLPVDQHHGKGGTYVVRNGVRNAAHALIFNPEKERLVWQKKYMRKAAILVKLEVTPGVDPNPTGAANAVITKEFTLTPIDGDEVEHKQIRPFFGAFDTELAAYWSKLEFQCYACGSGTPGVEPNYDPLMQIAACSVNIVEDVSVTYAPISDAIKTGTIYVNIDGVNQKLTHVHGDVAMDTDAKGLPILKFSLTGLYNPATDTPLPTPVYPAYARAVPVNAANTTLTLHGVSCKANKFGAVGGNAVNYRNVIGEESVNVVDRNSSYSATFDAVDMATKNWNEVARTGVTGALTLVHGKQVGNILTFAAGRSSVKKPSIGEVDGIRQDVITGALIPSAAGNDEWSLTLT